MKILLITDDFGTVSKPNAVCSKTVLDCIPGEDDIVVVCPKGVNQASKEKIGKYEVYRVRKAMADILLDLSKGGNVGKKGQFLAVAGRLLLYAGMLLNYYRFPMNSSFRMRRFKKVVKAIEENGPFDVVMVTYNPIESFEILKMYKKRNPSTLGIIYMLDAVSNRGNGNIVSQKSGSEKGLYWENLSFPYADLILIPDSHWNHYHTDRYVNYFNKMEKIDFPLMNYDILFDNGKVNDNKTTIECLYTGKVDMHYRNPATMCKIFYNLSEVNLSVYQEGNCEELFEKYAAKNIKVKGFIPRSEIIKKQRETDLLVSIGNKGLNMVPSKIFEYMATGKSILHIALDAKDPAINYLEKYPLALIVQENQYDMDVIRNFILKSKQEKVSKDVLHDIFAMNEPEYTADIIMRRVEKDNGNS